MMVPTERQGVERGADEIGDRALRRIGREHATADPNRDHEQADAGGAEQLAVHQLLGADAGEDGFEELVRTLLDRALEHPAARQHQADHQQIGGRER